MIGTKTNGYDCIVIPQPSKAASPYTEVAASKMCGRSKGVFTAAATATTVCCK